MPRAKKTTEDRNYFAEREEQAVRDYLASKDSRERDMIYSSILMPAFEQMVKAIIRRYKLYIPKEEFDDTYRDTLTYLITKMDKYNPDRNHKAYSYYGTICKRYLCGRIGDYTKELQMTKSYDDSVFNTIANRIEHSDYSQYDSKLAKNTVKVLSDRVREMLDETDGSLKESERIMGKALINLLENWDYVLSTDGNTKLNKSTVLLFLKDATGFDTKGVRDNMRKFKNEMLEIRKNLLD